MSQLTIEFCQSNRHYHLKTGWPLLRQLRTIAPFLRAPFVITEFVKGQRFISEAEPELGPGQVIEVSGRNITLEFQAAATTRQYALANAPLTRIRFDTGDKVQDRKGTHCTVLAVKENAGLLQYEVNGTNPHTSRMLPETELFPHLSLSQPLKRLLVGQVESPAWYQLRLAALKV